MRGEAKRQTADPSSPVLVKGPQGDDPYAWFRNRDDPAVGAHLAAENAYSDSCLAHLSALQSVIFEEIVTRLDLDRQTVPVPHGDWEYLTRTEEERSYAVHYRRPAGGNASLEEVVLDENAVADELAYFALEYLIAV